MSDLVIKCKIHAMIPSTFTDPCEDIDREDDLVDDGSRSPNCRSGNTSLCDRLTSGWRRVLAEDLSYQLTIPQSCPEFQSCGTENPIWLNGDFHS